MPVAPRFLTITPGQWTPICDQRDLRRSLLVCALGSDVVLSTTTNVPMATGPDGPTPAGIYLEGGASGDLGAPTIFRLSSSIDNDLITQEWFATIATTATPSAGHLENPFTDLGGGTLRFAGVLLPGEVVVFAICANTGPTPQTLTSAISGAIAAFHTQVVTDGAGDSAILSTFMWHSPGGAETVTVQAGATDTVTGELLSCPNSLALDVWGVATNSGPFVIALASGPEAAIGELCCAACVSVQGTAGTTFIGTEWTGLAIPLTPISSPDASTWQLDVATGVFAFLATPQIGFIFSAPVHAGQAIVFALTGVPPVAGSALVSVFEAFDSPPSQDAETTFTVRLPELDDAGKRHLETLRERVRERDQEQAQASTQEPTP
jgi:hypothetical protein